MDNIITLTKPNQNTCDEIALRHLSFDNIIEAKHSRKFIEEISAYHYEGKFEDNANLIIGPDYTILLADSGMDEESHIAAYSIGLRSKEHSRPNDDICDIIKDLWTMQ